MQKFRLDAGRTIIFSFIGSALIAYLHVTAYALGASHPKIISPFYGSQDLYADFFKILASFPFVGDIKLESWFPVAWRGIIEGYLLNNPYGNDPSIAHISLTNYHSPPFGILLLSLFGALCKSLGGGTTFAIAITAILSWLAALLHSSGFRGRSTVFILPCFLLYPSLFSLTRGHVWSYFTALCLTSSFILALHPKGKPWIPALLLGIAINIRPNNIFYLPLLILALPRIHGILRLSIISIGATCGILLASSFLAPLIYPTYSIDTFFKAYSVYSRLYEYGIAGFDYNSSPLPATLAIVRHIFSDLRIAISDDPIRIIRAVLVLCGSLVCLSSWKLCLSRAIGIPKALLLCTLGIIIATPVFADYHLLTLLSPLLCSRFAESDLAQAYLDPCPSILRPLARIDYLLITLLILPKSFPLPFTGGSTAQAFLNPLIIFLYLLANCNRIIIGRGHRVVTV